ncbi:MAG TPA: hypothetical protein VKY31_16160 [Terriglobia bacterium]|nr:hypothetical protein [Terriglobia bacterium]
MHRTALLSLAALLVAALAFGEDFWIKKDYTQWNDEEVKKIMTNSPWAKDVTVTVPATAVGGRGGPASSGINVEDAGGRGGRGGRGARGPQGDTDNAAPTEVPISLTVSWRSALPLRKALVKTRLGSSTEVPADARQLLAKEQEEYVIVVSGVPARMARLVQDPVQFNRSSLKIGKKAPLTPKGVDFQTRTQTIDVVFVFPKMEAITLDDKEVEIDLKLGPINAKRKFSLKDMVYNGKLEL